MKTQLNRGQKRRLMYVESKFGEIDGADARIGWVSFSKSGRSVYYRGRELLKANGRRGNFIDIATGEEFWVSGVKKRGSNTHWAEADVSVAIDPDAQAEYEALRAGQG